MKRVLILALLLLACIAGGFLWGRNHAISGVKTQTDTLIVTKVIRGENAPIFAKEFKGWDITPLPRLITLTDTLKVPYAVVERDTVTVYVPIDEYYFEANEGRLRLWTSGYNVKLDKWEVDETVRMVSPKFKHRFLTISAEPRIQKNPQIVVSAKYGYTTKWGLSFYGGAGYDCLSCNASALVGCSYSFGW